MDSNDVKAAFLDKYLEHLERQDSREGATKWIMLAAVAALLWQLSTVIFSADVRRTGELFAMGAALLFVIDMARTASSSRTDATRLRFLPVCDGLPFMPQVVFVIFRNVLVVLCFFGLFNSMPNPYRYAVVIPPLLVASLFVWFALRELRQSYDVRAPRSETKSRKSDYVALCILVVPVIVGLGWVVLMDAPWGELSGEGKVKSFQAAGLGVVILLIVDKYTKNLRVDSQIRGVRRVWRRRGLGEISVEEAADELRLIIVGASLDEVTSKDVASFSSAAETLEEMEALTKQELDRFKQLDSTETVLKAALGNSLAKRRSDISSAVVALGARRQEIIDRIKKLVAEGLDNNGEIKQLEQSLAARYEARKKSWESLEPLVCAAID